MDIVDAPSKIESLFLPIDPNTFSRSPHLQQQLLHLLGVNVAVYHQQLHVSR